jgi:hypothetical protein
MRDSGAKWTRAGIRCNNPTNSDSEFNNSRYASESLSILYLLLG